MAGIVISGGARGHRRFCRHPLGPGLADGSQQGLPLSGKPLVMKGEVRLQKCLNPLRHRHDPFLAFLPVRSALAIDAQRALLLEDIFRCQAAQLRDPQARIEVTVHAQKQRLTIRDD